MIWWDQLLLLFRWGMIWKQINRINYCFFLRGFWFVVCCLLFCFAKKLVLYKSRFGQRPLLCVVFFYFLSFHNFLNTDKCKNIIVAGANAGIKQNGKLPIPITPWEPVSMEILVVIIAVVKTERMSKIPKIFQAIVKDLAYRLLLFSAFTTKILNNAVAISPIPAM